MTISQIVIYKCCEKEYYSYRFFTFPARLKKYSSTDLFTIFGAERQEMFFGPPFSAKRRKRAVGIHVILFFHSLDCIRYHCCFSQRTPRSADPAFSGPRVLFALFFARAEK